MEDGPTYSEILAGENAANRRARDMRNAASEIVRVYRMHMETYPDAKLDAISRDDGLRQVERDVALSVLAERRAEKSRGDEAEAGAALRRSRRESAAASVSAEDNDPLPGDPGPPMSINEEAALAFAWIFRKAGMKCEAKATKALANRGAVKDGWVVNFHDPDLEIGFVAAWWGRGHFQAFAEVAGHHDRSIEAARRLSDLWLIWRGDYVAIGAIDATKEADKE